MSSSLPAIGGQCPWTLVSPVLPTHDPNVPASPVFAVSTSVVGHLPPGCDGVPVLDLGRGDHCACVPLPPSLLMAVSVTRGPGTAPTVTGCRQTRCWASDQPGRGPSRVKGPQGGGLGSADVLDPSFPSELWAGARVLGAWRVPTAEGERHLQPRLLLLLPEATQTERRAVTSWGSRPPGTRPWCLTESSPPWSSSSSGFSRTWRCCWELPRTPRYSGRVPTGSRAAPADAEGVFAPPRSLRAGSPAPVTSISKGPTRRRR